MKYCKSKRGYFYKVVGDKKTRISMEEYKAGCKKRVMKGGFTEDGNVEAIDFDFDSRLTNIHNNNSLTRTTGVPILVKYNKNNIPYVFFGYTRQTGTFRYVMYYNGEIFVFKKLGNYIGDTAILEENIDQIPKYILLNLRTKFKEEVYEKNKGNEKIKEIYDYLKNQSF